MGVGKKREGPCSTITTNARSIVFGVAYTESVEHKHRQRVLWKLESFGLKRDKSGRLKKRGTPGNIKEVH